MYKNYLLNLCCSGTKGFEDIQYSKTRRNFFEKIIIFSFNLKVKKMKGRLLL
jgi:hypothetical protein